MRSTQIVLITFSAAVVSFFGVSSVLPNVHCVHKYCKSMPPLSVQNDSFVASSSGDCAQRIIDANLSLLTFAWRSVAKLCLPLAQRCPPLDLLPPSGEFVDFHYCRKACDQIRVEGANVNYSNAEFPFPLPGSIATVSCNAGDRIGPSRVRCEENGALQPHSIPACAPFINVPKICGGGITLRQPGVFYSPNYPGEYPHLCEMIYSIIAPEYSRVLLTVTRFAGEGCHDYISVSTSGQGFDSNPLMICGAADSWPQTVQSQANSMKILFKSDVSVSNSGFRAHFSFISDCPMVHVANAVITTVQDDSQILQYWLPVISAEVHVHCKDNFTIEGESILKCLETGNWSSPMPTCRPDVLQNGKQFTHSPDNSNTDAGVHTSYVVAIAITVAIIAFLLGMAAAALVLHRRWTRNDGGLRVQMSALEKANRQRHGEAEGFAQSESGSSTAVSNRLYFD